MSSISWRITANRSIPKPKAKPCHSSGSIPQLLNTLGWTIPQPPSSSQEPSGREMSNSADGSVNGKYDGRSRLLTSPPKKALTNSSMVPARSPIVMLRSTAKPSIWLKAGRWVASAVSARKVRPGATM